jgi:hypothetical protein
LNIHPFGNSETKDVSIEEIEPFGRLQSPFFHARRLIVRWSNTVLRPTRNGGSRGAAKAAADTLPSAGGSPGQPVKVLCRCIAVSCAIFAVMLAVYVLSPVRTSTDSRWSLHTAMSLVRGNGGDLTEYMTALQRNDFYMIDYSSGRPRTFYPIGASILAMPAVAIRSWIEPGFFAELQNGIPDRFEQIVASTIGAAAVVVFFWLMYSRFGSPAIAVAATAIFALGSSMWSTATRALWQHGPEVLMFSIAMLLAVRAQRRPSLIQYAGLALALAYIMRPTAAVAIIAVTVYVLAFYRGWLLRYIGWAMVAAVPWIAFNYWIYGEIFPPYYAPERGTELSPFGEGWLGVLFSPSRGLLIFTPVAVFAVSGFLLSLREREQRPLHIAFATITIGITGICASWPIWWGGHCYGPRLLTDIVPFLVYFVAFNFRLPAGTPRPARFALAGSVGILAAIGVAIHGHGALRTPPSTWSVFPSDVDQNTDRLWDWSDPQFLRISSPP